MGFVVKKSYTYHGNKKFNLFVNFLVLISVYSTDYQYFRCVIL